MEMRHVSLSGREITTFSLHARLADLAIPLSVLPCCSETYEYFSLPFCAPEGGVKYKTLGMGEVVDANRMASTPYMLNFNTDRTNAVICETPLSQDNLVKFRKVSMLQVRDQFMLVSDRQCL